MPNLDIAKSMRAALESALQSQQRVRDSARNGGELATMDAVHSIFLGYLADIVGDLEFQAFSEEQDRVSRPFPTPFGDQPRRQARGAALACFDHAERDIDMAMAEKGASERLEALLRAKGRAEEALGFIRKLIEMG